MTMQRIERHEPPRGGKRSAVAALAAAAGAAMAAAAVGHWLAARAAERRHPPKGRFVEVDGTRLHVVERGSGPPLVLLHGNGASSDDFLCSGFVDLAAQRYRVIAFDRPGFGHSPRPRGRRFTAARQADLIRHAMARLGAPRAIVLGHSWGTLVALQLALRHPDAVDGLALVSGYYFPTARFDTAAFSPPAIPAIGDVIRYTAAPPIARLMWPALIAQMFAPRDVPASFAAFPRSLALRPEQLRASAEESAMMTATAAALAPFYGAVEAPVAIVAGDGDRIASPLRQSARLHRTLRGATFRLVPGVGHMVHHSAPAQVMAAVDDVARAAAARPLPAAAIEVVS